MSKEKVLKGFIGAKGKRHKVGGDLPDESKDNLEHYRRLGCIGVPGAPPKKAAAPEKDSDTGKAPADALMEKAQADAAKVAEKAQADAKKVTDKAVKDAADILKKSSGNT